ALPAGTYTVTVTDGNNCTATDNVTLNDPAPVTADIGTYNDPSCQGCNDGSATVTASGGSGDYFYVWSSGGTDTTETGLSEGIYYVTVSDINTCTAVYSVILTDPDTVIISLTVQINQTCEGECNGTATISAVNGAMPYTYNWSNGGTDTTTIDLCAGVYTVTVTDANLVTATTSVTITAYTLPVVTLSALGSVCTDSPGFVLTGGSPSGGIYSGAGIDTTGHFYPYIAGIGTHSITYTFSDTNFCSNSDTQNITVFPGPVLQFDVTDASCSNATDGGISITATGEIGILSYLWSKDSINTSVIEDLVPGTYSVTVTDSIGCITTGSADVGELYTIVAYAGDDMVICQGNSVQLSDELFYDPGYTYTWTPAQGLNNPNILTPMASPSDTTIYILTAGISSECSATDTVVISVVPQMALDAGPDVLLFYGESAILHVSGGSTGSEYSWYPAEGLSDTNSSDPVAEAVVELRGNTTTYYVTATTPEGCTATDSVTVRTLDAKIPKGFTPNGDGVNDTWVLDYLSRYNINEVEIFNRWGKRVFSSTGYPDPWDGKFNGNDLPAGTYYYLISVDSPDSSIPINGSVTIVR
ncbi:MAG: gliding motility-associated C-terminal domain-containing protein, partial [Bacteroidetes bacterium]|nr:gliding motility-associated C-terminal domain-containing protein [Bacteroidota bacterium]